MFHDPGRDRWRDDGVRYDDPAFFDTRRARSPEPGDGPGYGDEDRRYVEARTWDDRDDAPGRMAREDRRPDEDDRREGDRRRARGEYDFGRTDRRYSLDDTRRRLPREETERLIASDRVEGAPVYDLHGRRIGEVENFMVDKRSGRVEYAVIRVRGGVFSGQAYRPVDWMDLEYDERLDGYRIDTDRRELRRDRDFERYR